MSGDRCSFKLIKELLKNKTIILCWQTICISYSIVPRLKINLFYRCSAIISSAMTNTNKKNQDWDEDNSKTTGSKWKILNKDNKYSLDQVHDYTIYKDWEHYKTMKANTRPRPGRNQSSRSTPSPRPIPKTKTKMEKKLRNAYLRQSCACSIF